MLIVKAFPLDDKIFIWDSDHECLFRWRCDGTEVDFDSRLEMIKDVLSALGFRWKVVIL